MSPWRHLEHRADIGVEGRGATPAEAFEQAALALTAVVTDPAGVRAERAVHLELAAPDLELLLVELLDAMVYRQGAEGLLFGRCRAAIDGSAGAWHLRVTLWGERVDPARHAPAVEVKGVTLSGLFVGEEDGAFVARTVVDV